MSYNYLWLILNGFVNYQQLMIDIIQILLQKRFRFPSTTEGIKQDNRYIRFGDFVQPICLPSLDKTKTEYSQKRGCKFSGWNGGKSGEHYLVGHAAEINKANNCKNNADNTSSSKHNCLSIRSLSPPKYSTEKINKKRKPQTTREEDSSHENGMPLVCLNSTSHSSHHQQHNQQLAENAVDQYELIGLYSASKTVLNINTRDDKPSRLKTKEKNSLQFLNISPYLSWIQVRLSL